MSIVIFVFSETSDSNIGSINPFLNDSRHSNWITDLFKSTHRRSWASQQLNQRNTSEIIEQAQLIVEGATGQRKLLISKYELL